MLPAFVTRLRALVARRSADADLDDELRYHLEREIERNVAGGMSPADARHAAQRAFGNVTVATENARDASRWRAIEELRQDTAFALRGFRRAPLFVVTVVATIALGLGLLSSAFTFFDAYVLRPLAVRDPHSLYDLSWMSANGRTHRFTWTQFQRLKSETGIFSESFASNFTTPRVRGRPAHAQLVTGNYFEMLGVGPALGRIIVPGDAERENANAVLVLSHQAWRSMFGGDSSVIGKRINVNGTSLEIVGVAREGFGGLTSAPFDFWFPITMTAASPTPSIFKPDGGESVVVVARLAPGVTQARATALFHEWMRRETAALPPLERARGVTLSPKGTAMPANPEVAAMFGSVIGAFLLVMLIACANVANLMLARGMARQREIGIRIALGAGRSRIVRQLLTEALLLAVPAGVLGFALSRLALWASVSALFATMPATIAGFVRLVPLDADARIVVFVLAGVCGAAIAFGLVPALQASRPNVVQASRGDFDTQFRPSRLRNMLVVAQVTMSVLLLVSAGILLASARRTERIDPGIRTSDVVQIELLARFRERSIDALRRDPLVRGMATSNSTALDASYNQIAVATNRNTVQRASYLVVSSGWFSVLDLPMLAGRAFTDDEARTRAPVAIVSQSTAHRLWPGQDPIGQSLTIPMDQRDYRFLESYKTTHVIGVTRDAVPGWIGQDATGSMVYFPQPLEAASWNLLVGVTGDGERGRMALERTLAAVDSSAVVEMHTLAAAVAIQVYPFRAMYWVATGLGAIALVLTLIGLYGVMSYLVTQRRKEFGIRLALGAAGSSLVALVLRQSIRLSVLGVGIGCVMALGVSRLFATAIPTVDTFDLFGYAGGIGLVIVACLFAAYGPSRRAAAVDPVEVLRAE